MGVSDVSLLGRSGRIILDANLRIILLIGDPMIRYEGTGRHPSQSKT
jgi:hypothetical protein